MFTPTENQERLVKYLKGKDFETGMKLGICLCCAQNFCCFTDNTFLNSLFFALKKHFQRSALKSYILFDIKINLSKQEYGVLRQEVMRKNSAQKGKVKPNNFAFTPASLLPSHYRVQYSTRRNSAALWIIHLSTPCFLH